MNDTERAALVEAMATIEWRRLGGEESNGTIRIDDYQFTELVSRLLTTKPEPEPDAVHAVHEALVNSAPDWIIDREDGELFDMARAALAAAGDAPDVDVTGDSNAH